MARGLHGLFRLHQRRIVDWTPGRPRAGAREFDSPAGLPHSRWVPVRGESDQVVIWSQPKRKPVWMSDQEYAALPAELTVRELRYRVESPGFRVGEVTVVTTMLEATAYPAEEVARL